MRHYADMARLALAKSVRRRAALVALVVGTILNLINQGDAVAHGLGVNWAKLLLTYLVPYLVSTHGAVAARLEVKAPDRPAS